jgi:peptidoglycan/LPS O-acetylase OafA/YrhL
MQMQDLPPSTAFNIGWSLQLEVACYFMFPVFYLALRSNDLKQVVAFYLFFLAMRFWVIYLNTENLFLWSYGSIFGGGTIFLTGMIAAKVRALKIGRLSTLFLFSGLFIVSVFVYFVWRNGGYQNPNGWISKTFIFLMPEIMSVGLFLSVKGFLTVSQVRFNDRNIGYRYLCYFGKISYSAYLLSLFNLDLCQRLFSFIIPDGWFSFACFSILYFLMLSVIASISFYAIEKPFLQLRKVYIFAQEKHASSPKI